MNTQDIINMELQMSIETNWDLDSLDMIYFRTQNDGWRLWTIVAKSSLATLDEKLQENPCDFGYGLIAGRDFQPGDYIGKFTGFEVSEEDVNRIEDTNWIVQLNNINIDTRHGNTGFVQFVNDAFETTSTNNALMNARGYLVASENIEAGDEILCSYGPDYWEK